jgi:hypothetical protein
MTETSIAARGASVRPMVHDPLEQCAIFIAQNARQQQLLFSGNADIAEITITAAKRIAEPRRTTRF